MREMQVLCDLIIVMSLLKLAQVLETFEDEEHGALARVQVGQVMVQQVQPQVATEFIYEPGQPEE